MKKTSVHQWLNKNSSFLSLLLVELPGYYLGFHHREHEGHEVVG